MTLFQAGMFDSHSGVKLSWKIECDALTDDDLATLACVAAKQLEPFCLVIGIKRGGARLACALDRYVRRDATKVLIVDDVLTTGSSMEKAREEIGDDRSIGLVIFARGVCPDWIKPIFQVVSKELGE